MLPILRLACWFSKPVVYPQDLVWWGLKLYPPWNWSIENVNAICILKRNICFIVWLRCGKIKHKICASLSFSRPNYTINIFIAILCLICLFRVHLQQKLIIIQLNYTEQWNHFPHLSKTFCLLSLYLLKYKENQTWQPSWGRLWKFRSVFPPKN